MVSRKGSLTLTTPLTFRNQLSGFNASSANTHTARAWKHTNTQASCSDMLRLWIPYFSSSQRPGLNSTEGRAHKTEATEYYKQTHKCSRVRREPPFCLFFCNGSSVGLFFLQKWAEKRSPKQYQSVFITPDMNYSPKPSERFRRKYFLWMCLRECVRCRQKTKLGAIYFLHSTVS